MNTDIEKINKRFDEFLEGDTLESPNGVDITMEVKVFFEIEYKALIEKREKELIKNIESYLRTILLNFLPLR